MVQRFSNLLTDAELERLAILSEEMGEAQQCIRKILRHGYNSTNPEGDKVLTNRAILVRELGDVRCVIEMMTDAADMSHLAIARRALYKRQKIKRYLHHQQ